MITVDIAYIKNGAKKTRSVRMIEDEGFFKHSFGDVTILYDNRTPPTKYQWGFQIENRARHFFENFEKMTVIANDWSERMKLGFKIQYSVISRLD